jgi:hypothetical protein
MTAGAAPPPHTDYSPHPSVKGNAIPVYLSREELQMLDNANWYRQHDGLDQFIS